MMFDRSTPGDGVEVECVPENGKALLIWRFQFAGEQSEALLWVTVTDREGNVVLECLHQEPEEEPLQAVLLHPKFWCGTENPYQYQMKVCLLGWEGCTMDEVTRQLPLRRLEKHPDKGYFLNGAPFYPKTVNYALPAADSEAGCQSRIFRDMDMLLQLGANSIYCRQWDKGYKTLQRLCDRLGLLLWPEASEINFRGGEHCLLDSVTDRPVTLFYQCRAHWSNLPFVYIAPESVGVTENGRFKAIVYSNCSKVVLYTDGILFEIQSGEWEFSFEEIPAKHPCVMLSAEGDGCVMSLSIQKSRIKSNGRLS